MAKNKTSKKVKEEKPLSFIGGTLSDGILNYAFEIKQGVGIGNTHNVKGKGLFMDSLAQSFAKLNVHLASIDDVFKHSGIAVENINKMRPHELTLLYTVEAFKVSTTGDEESVVLTGSKRIESSGSWMSISTPKIPLDKLSSYEFASDLDDVLDDVREEVERYHNGHFIEQEKPEKVDKAQMKISDQIGDDEFEVTLKKGKI